MPRSFLRAFRMGLTTSGFRGTIVADLLSREALCTEQEPPGDDFPAGLGRDIAAQITCPGIMITVCRCESRAMGLDHLTQFPLVHQMSLSRLHLVEVFT